MLPDTASNPIGVPVGKIRIDGGTQPRQSIDSETVEHYAQILDLMPPSVVFFDGVHYWLADGFHRFHAHRRVKRAAMLCEKHIGTIRDAILYAVGANNANGLRMTDLDQRHACRLLLLDDEWGKWCDQTIAKQCGVNPKLVAEERRLLRKEEAERTQREKEAQRRQEENERKEEDAQAKAEKDALKNSFRPGSSHSVGAQSEKTPDAQEQERRIYRTKHGTVAQMRVGKIGKGKRRHEIRIETNKDMLAGLDGKIERSEKKYLSQCIRRGLSDSEIHERVGIRLAKLRNPES